MASPSGEIYATQYQVNRLEEIILKQQSIIESLEKNKHFLLEDLSKNIDAQIEEATKRRGSIGSEYLNITKFISKQLAEGFIKIQEQVKSNIEESFPLKVLQELEKRLIAKPMANVDLTVLANRISHLENTIMKDTYPKINESHTINSLEEIQSLKDKIQNLESTLLQEVQRAYKTVNRPGDYGSPLAKIQSQISVLQNDVNIIKSVDGQTLAESFLNKIILNLKNNLKEQIDGKVSYEEFSKFQNDISRIESFSREVQTCFYEAKMKQEKEHENILQNIIKYNTESQIKIKNDIEELINININKPKYEYEVTSEKINILLKNLQNIKEQFEINNKEYSPDALKIKIEDMYNTLTSKNNIFQNETIIKLNEKINSELKSTKEEQFKYLSNKIEGFRKEQFTYLSNEIEGLRKEQFDFISKINENTNIDSLKATYDYFKNKLEEQYILFNKFEEKLNVMQISYTQEIEKYRELQNSLFSKFSVLLTERTEQWLGERTKTLTLRIGELSQQVRDIIEQANQREKELLQLYSDNTLKGFVSECERRLKTTQDNWMQRRTEELHMKYSDMERNLILIKKISMESQLLETRLNKNYSEEAMARFISQIDMKLLAFQNIMKERGNVVNTRDRAYTGLTKCFYTAIFSKPGQICDTLAPVQYKIPGWKYICFTNIQMESTNGWHIVYIPNTYTITNTKLEAKKYKWLSHKYLSDFDIAVWIDAYIGPNPMYNEILKQWIMNMIDTNTLILHRPHEQRDCVYDECDAVIEHKREFPNKVQRARELLNEHKIQRHNGLFDTNVIIKFHKNSKVQYISEEIYDYLQSVTCRDQIIIPLVYHKNNFKEYQEQQLLRAFSKSGNHVRIPV